MSKTNSASDLKKKFQKKDIRALSQLISLAENLDPEAYKILEGLFVKNYKGRVIGFTGSPGVGKSTIASRYIEFLRNEDQSIAMVAVDPMSPFTQGALLGDRVRMSQHFNDPGVYIRSLSTRGKLGGLSIAFRQTLHLIEAFGFDSILVETVGVGQSEVEIHKMADLVVVLLSPDGGDSIQALKSGIMEIADVFVINKSDRDGADKMKTELKISLEIFNRKDVPILLTTQNETESYDELFKNLETLFKNKATDILKKRKKQLEYTVYEIAEWWLKQKIEDKMAKKKISAENPYGAALKFIKQMK